MVHHSFMKAYSEDLRKKVVEAVKRGMKKSEAAYTFGLSLSSVKRYVGGSVRGTIAPSEEAARYAPEDRLQR